MSTVGDILLDIYCFHVVKPLMPILTTLCIMEKLEYEQHQ